MKIERLVSSKEKRDWMRMISFIIRTREPLALGTKLQKYRTHSNSSALFLPGLWWIEPLIRHRLHQSNSTPEELFDSSYRQLKLSPTSYQVLLKNDVLRRQCIAELSANLNAPLMLIKGMSISRYYPQSALREMEDIDAVVLEKDWHHHHQELLRNGWVNRRGNCWVHPKEVTLEVNFPKEKFAESVWHRAVVDERFSEGNILSPSPCDQLAILANHAAKSGGSRIWREFADAVYLLQHSNVTEESLGKTYESLSKDQQHHYMGFIRLINKLAPEFKLPEKESKESTAVMRLFIKMMTEPFSETSLNVLDNFFQNPLSRISRKQIPSDSTLYTTRDPQLGTLAHAGSTQRRFQKLFIFLRLFLFEHGWQKRSLILQRRKLHAHGKSFHSLEKKNL